MTAAPPTTITALRMMNRTASESGISSLERSLIVASKLAWKTATTSTLRPAR